MKLIVVDAGRAASGTTAITWWAPPRVVRIMNITCAVQTDATVANRYFGIRTGGPGGTPDLAMIPSLTAHPANTTAIYVWCAGYGYPQSSSSSYWLNPFPADGLLVPGEGRLQFYPFASNQAGDLLGPFNFTYIEE